MEQDEIKIKHLLWMQTEFAITRYLLSNTHGRLDGHEKAQRHLEISRIFAASKELCLPDEADWDLLKKIHDTTQSLTDNLDTEIGFPVGREFRSFETYEDFARKFFNKFYAIAKEVCEQWESE